MGNSGQTIVIIGGGIAGLSAAVHLLRHERRVVLLEARRGLGGRIRTVRHGAVPIELGAEFIHGCHEGLWNAIRDAGLTTHEVPARNQLFEDGALRSVDLWEKIGEVFHSIPPKEPDRPVRDSLETGNFDQFTRRLALGFVEGFDAADTRRISTNALLQAEASSERMQGDVQSRLNDGYGALVDFLAAEIRRLGGVVRTDAVVRSVTWKHRHADVSFHHHGKPETVAGDVAIVTLPLGALKTGAVAFVPPLPGKDDAVAALEVGNVVKLILVFREIWWPDADFGFIHAFDEPIPTWWSDPRGPLITAWCGGPKADALMHLDRQQIERRAIEILARIFGAKPDRIAPLVVATYYHGWREDPFAGGAYSYIPVNGLDLPKVLAEPVSDTLFFAGEATALDGQMGTVFSAFESGLRAAREITDRSAKEKKTPDGKTPSGVSLS